MVSSIKSFDIDDASVLIHCMMNPSVFLVTTVLQCLAIVVYFIFFKPAAGKYQCQRTVESGVAEKKDSIVYDQSVLDTPISHDSLESIILPKMSVDVASLSQKNCCRTLFHDKDTQTPTKEVAGRQRTPSAEEAYASSTDPSFPLSDHEIVKKSSTDPAILIGHTVFVKGYGIGIVHSIQKRKFQSTLFQIEFRDGSKEYLSLKRGARKGDIQFTVLYQ